MWRLRQFNTFSILYSIWSESLFELIHFTYAREWPNPVLLKQPEESNLNLPVWDPRVWEFTKEKGLTLNHSLTKDYPFFLHTFLMQQELLSPFAVDLMLI